jgi:hypothetical protein
MQSIELIRDNLANSRDRVLARIEEMREHAGKSRAIGKSSQVAVRRRHVNASNAAIVWRSE